MPLGSPEDRRRVAAYERLHELERMLYHLYMARGVRDPPKLFPVPEESLDPDWVGPEEDGFPEFGAGRGQLLIAEVGRFVAAIGGYLELRAVFTTRRSP